MVDLDEIKVVLHSHLISTQNRLTTYDLARLYQESEGCPCPFAALGYRSFAEFLADIPDTVTLLPNNVVRPVSNEQTYHIQKFVALQKSSKPKRRSRAPPRFGRGSHGSSFGSRPFNGSRPSPAASGWSRPASSSASVSRSRDSPTRAEPPSYSRYRPSSSQGRPASPWNQSRNSYYDDPRSSAGPSSSQGRPASPWNQPRNSNFDDPRPSATIEEHFARVKQAKEQARREAQRSVTPVEAGWSGDAFIKDWKKQQSLKGCSRTPRLVPEADFSDSDDDFYERFKDEPGENVNNERGERGHYETEPTEAPNLGYTVSDKMKANLRSLIKEFPKGLRAYQLPVKYQERYGVHLNWSELGFDSVVQMAHELSDVFVCERVDDGDWRLLDANMAVPAEQNTENLNGEPTPTLSESLKRRIYSITEKYKSGIRMEQLVQLYEEHYGKPLLLEGHGFVDTKSLFLSIQDSVVHLKYYRSECFVFPCEQPPQTPLSLSGVDSSIKKQMGRYPEEVLGPGETYPPPIVPDNLEPGTDLALKVAEVYNPSKFWIMLTSYSAELNQLMDELQDFYNDHGHTYTMPESTVITGQCCTAVYDNEWHRAIIKSVSNKVEVLYVDYGTVAEVPKSELRFIRRDFCELPIQAIRAKMSGLRPPNGRKWFTKEANRALLNLVVDRTLIGVVQRFDPEEPFFELFLVDTNGEKDIHLNDLLVDEKHAVFCWEEEESEEKTEVAPVQQLAEPVSSEAKATVQMPSEAEAIIPVSHNLTAQANTYTSQIGSSLFQANAQSSVAPPPGFMASANQTQTVPVPVPVPPVVMGGVPNYGTNPLYNPMFNPAMTPYLPQMQALLMQQQLQYQQQQAALLAQYQNLYTQYLASQSKAAIPVASGMEPSRPANVSNTQSNAAVTSPGGGDQISSTSDLAENSLKNTVTSVNTEASPSSSTSHRERWASKILSASESSSASMQSDSSEDYSKRKKKMLKKKIKRGGTSTPCSSAKITPSQAPKCPEPKLVADSSRSANINDVASVTNVRRNYSHDPRVLLSEDSSSTFEDPNGLVVSTLEELMGTSSISSLSPSPSSSSISADIVQDVATLNIAHQDQITTPTQFWKVIDVGGESVHLFNIDNKAYVSTGEIVRKFTPFSALGALLRVLKTKEIDVPFRKVPRAEKLPMFSALDGYEDSEVNNFELIRNKNGSVIGFFHLTPLINVPTILITVGTDIKTVKRFQEARQNFDPHDSHWTC